MPLIPFDGQLDDEPIGGKLVPFDGELDDEPKKKRKATWGESLAQGAAQIGNTADLAWSTLAGGAAALFGDDEEALDIEEQRKARKATRDTWGKPQEAEQSFVQKAVNAVNPLSLITSGLSPAATVDIARQAGETDKAALKAGMVDAAGNAVGMILPGFKQGAALTRVATGAGANVAQEYATRKVIQDMLETEQGKAQFQPTAEDLALAGLAGGAMAGLAGKRPVKKGKPSPIDAIRAEAPKPVAPIPDVQPEQLRLFDQFEERSPISKYQTEMAPDMWRVDENGIPIRADLSMEVQNLQQPLQRNLWGDELEANFPRDPNKPLDMETGDIPGVERFSDPVQFRNDPEGQIPLTEAIDAMPEGVRARNPDGSFVSGTTRQNALDLLRGEMKADAALEVGKMEADGPKIPLGSKARKEAFIRSQRGQRGVMAPDVFLKDFPEFVTSKIKDASGQLKALFRGVRSDYDGPERPMLGTFGEGVYLTESTSLANTYATGPESGRHVKQAYVDIKRPYEIEMGSPEHRGILRFDKDARKQFSDQMKAAGFDGVILKADGEMKEVMAFKPEQVQNAFSTPSSRIPKSQRGALKVDWADETTKLESELLKSEDGSYIPKNPDTSVALEAARGEADGKLLTYAQSGAVNAAMKTGSTLIKTVGNLVQAAGKRADLATRKYVLPAETALRKLSREELTQLGDVFKDEMFQDYRYDGDLLAKHLTVKQLEAYTKMRDVFDATLSAQNEARVAKGQKPITAKEAYLSSRWQGDFRVPVYDADGKLVWYLADTTQRGVNNQLKALLAKEPSLKAGKPHVVKSLKGGADIQSMYSTMLDILGRDDPAVQRIKELVEMDVGDDTANMLAQEKHFKSKSGVRGFAGDRPGFHKTKDTIRMFEQQIQYAKNAFQWSEMQKNADDLKMLLSDEELANKQPNNMKFAREYVKNALGQGEGKLAKAFDDTVREMGLSPAVLDKAVGGVKSFFITQKLAVSTGYTLANLVQTTNMVPYLANLSSQGYHANAAKAMAIGYTGALPMALAHYMRAFGGGEYKTFFGDMPNKFMEGALKYAEDNGITSRSIYDEAPIGTGFNPLKKVERAASFTISAPETVVRSAAFLTYAYYLKDSGKFKDMQAVFQKAEDLVNMSMVDYRATEKPLMFSKAGTVGNVANTLQTYPMSFYNQYKYMLNEALQGRPGGLATMLVMQGAIAGAAGMPYFEDLTNLYKLMRDNLLSDAQWAKAMKHPFFSDPKLWMLENLGESSVYGALSTQTGLGLTSRVTAPSLEAMSQAPFGPAVDLSKQVVNLGKAALDPTNTSKVGQAAMGSIPTGLQGWLETQPFMKDITFVENADGTKTFMKTSDLADRKGGYTRTEDEVNIRKWGLRSQQEVLSRDVNWAAQQANMGTKERTTGLVEKIYDAARQGNTEKVKQLRQLLIDLTGKDISSEQLQNQLLEEQMDDVARNVRNSKTPQQMLNTARSLKILEGE